jgi:flagellar hook-associated protein 3 FlgL
MALSFLAIMNTPRRAVADMQRQLMDRQREASTGRKADVGLSLGGRTHQAVSLRYDFDLNSTQIDANRLTSGQLDLTQNILSSVTELAHQFTSTLIGSRNAVNGQQLIKQAAEQALSGLTALLNTTHDGQFLFGGINSGAQPVADYDSVPASAAKSTLDADFLAQFGFSQSSASVTSITTAQMDALVAGAFSNEFSPAGWSANWSTAANENRTVRADQGQVLEIPVNANLQPIREMAMALTMMIDLGTGKLSQGTFQALVDKATALTAKSADAIGEVQALVGNVQYQISAATERLTSRNNILQKEIIALEGIDPYEAATRVNTLTNQLEASYALTARLSRLSLMDYI